MATLTADFPEKSKYHFKAIRNPTVLFWIAAVVILGGCATEAALGHWSNQPNRDLYQHMATLRALIADIGNPSNPFVATNEGTRHFHPYWVGVAYIAKSFGWSLTQAIAAASYFSMAVLAYGFWTFGRSYFRSNWAPVTLLAVATLSWSLPISHTGFINVPTLAEGAGYPAQLLNGLSLVLWAVIIKSLARPALAILIVPLVAFMFTTHQLGAGLGLIVATCITLFWPEGSRRAQLLVVTAIAGGLLLSIAWPYHNPFELIWRAGNPTWPNGIDWYSFKYYFALLVPSAIGIFGLLRPVVSGTGRPLIVALLILLVGFVAGGFGFQSGTRFAPVAILLLQIGIAGMLVRLFENPKEHSDRFKLAVVATSFGTVLTQAILLGFFYYPMEYRIERYFGDVSVAAEKLTESIPDDQPVAAYDVAAWPIAAAGQKVLSVPWPEPMISDLPQRQEAVAQLFSSRITRQERISLAKEAGVRTLILDMRFGPSGWWLTREFRPLQTDAVLVRRYGPLVRLDLF